MFCGLQNNNEKNKQNCPFHLLRRGHRRALHGPHAYIRRRGTFRRCDTVHCILGVLTPAAIPGVALGCMISNLVTGGVVWDIVFGSLASLIGMLGVRAMRRWQWLAPAPYVAANVIVVPLVLRWAYAAEGTIPYFALTVGIGEVVCAWGLGILLLAALQRTKADRFFTL